MRGRIKKDREKEREAENKEMGRTTDKTGFDVQMLSNIMFGK